jgi:hypothetical protein
MQILDIYVFYIYDTVTERASLSMVTVCSDSRKSKNCVQPTHDSNSNNKWTRILKDNDAKALWFNMNWINLQGAIIIRFNTSAPTCVRVQTKQLIAISVNYSNLYMQI